MSVYIVDDGTIDMNVLQLNRAINGYLLTKHYSIIARMFAIIYRSIITCVIHNCDISLLNMYTLLLLYYMLYELLNIVCFIKKIWCVYFLMTV